MEEPFHAECHLCRLSLMLSVTNKPLMLSVIKLNVVVLSVVAPHLYPSLTFSGKAGLTQVGTLIELQNWVGS